MKQIKRVFLGLFALTPALLIGCQGAERLEATNAGQGTIDILREDGGTTRLGPCGTAYVYPGQPLRVGDAEVRVGERVEIINTGTGLIRIARGTPSGEKSLLTLGEGARGYLDKTQPFRLGKLEVRIASY